MGWLKLIFVQYNFLSHDHLALNGNHNNGVNGQGGLDPLAHPPPPPPTNLMRSSPGSLLGGVGTPNTLFDQDTLSSLLGNDMSLSQNSAVGLDQMRQNAQLLSGQLGPYDGSSLQGPRQYGNAQTDLHRFASLPEYSNTYLLGSAAHPSCR